MSPRHEDARRPSGEHPAPLPPYEPEERQVSSKKTWAWTIEGLCAALGIVLLLAGGVLRLVLQASALEADVATLKSDTKAHLVDSAKVHGDYDARFRVVENGAASDRAAAQQGLQHLGDKLDAIQASIADLKSSLDQPTRRGR